MAKFCVTITGRVDESDLGRIASSGEKWISIYIVKAPENVRALNSKWGFKKRATMKVMLSA